MRRVAYIPVLLVMASVASSASASAGPRAQIKDRITSASTQPGVVKSLSPQRNAALPTNAAPVFTPDPTPFITEFYGPAKVEAKKPTPASSPAAIPEATVRTHTRSAQ